MIKFLCYSKCSTCKKAENWLIDNNIEYDKRDIKTENPTFDELEQWYKLSGLPLKKFFNTSGMLYREMELKDKIPSMTEQEQIQLLSQDGMLVKRPLVILEDKVLIGFKEKDWSDALK